VIDKVSPVLEHGLRSLA